VASHWGPLADGGLGHIRTVSTSAVVSVLQRDCVTNAPLGDAIVEKVEVLDRYCVMHNSCTSSGGDGNAGKTALTGARAG
jgi:hypothetical protein